MRIAQLTRWFSAVAEVVVNTVISLIYDQNFCTLSMMMISVLGNILFTVRAMHYSASHSIAIALQMCGNGF